MVPSSTRGHKMCKNKGVCVKYIFLHCKLLRDSRLLTAHSTLLYLVRRNDKYGKWQARNDLDWCIVTTLF